MNIKRGKFRKAKVKYNEDGSVKLDIPELTDTEAENLPTVSVVTITKDRPQFIASMLYIWSKYIYTPEKLEWVILDDSETFDMRDYLPDDPRIKYYKINEVMSIDDKRNQVVNLANHEVIVHMDDDDFYFPDSILAKVRTLMYYKAEGVMCFEIGIHDLNVNKSFVFDRPKHTNAVPEATMAYYKSYWLKNKFKNEKGVGEGVAFVKKNFGVWIDLHFLFSGICFTHKNNITGDARIYKGDDTIKQCGNFLDLLPENYKVILKNLN